MFSESRRQVKAFPRPHRIALLVDLNSVDIDQIETWITFSMQKWGGRFYPFIPLTRTSLPIPSEDLLIGCDPDYVISYEDVSFDLEKKFDSYLLP